MHDVAFEKLWCRCNFQLLTIFFNLRLKKLGGLIVFQSIRHRNQRRSWQLLRRWGSWTCRPCLCVFLLKDKTKIMKFDVEWNNKLMIWYVRMRIELEFESLRNFELEISVDMNTLTLAFSLAFAFALAFTFAAICCSTKFAKWNKLKVDENVKILGTYNLLDELSVASNFEKRKLYLRDLGGNRECFQSYSKVATIIIITDTIYTFDICFLRSNFECRNL